MDGADDPLCRKCMEWDETKQDQEMLTFMKELIAFRKTNQKTLTYGDLVWHIVDDENRIVAFSRTLDDKRLTFIFNQGSEAKTIQKADIGVTKDATQGIEIAAKSFAILED